MFELGVHDTDIEGNKLKDVRKLRLEDALKSTESVRNPLSTEKPEEKVKQ